MKNVHHTRQLPNFTFTNVYKPCKNPVRNHKESCKWQKFKKWFDIFAQIKNKMIIWLPKQLSIAFWLIIWLLDAAQDRNNYSYANKIA